VDFASLISVFLLFSSALVGGVFAYCYWVRLSGDFPVRSVAIIVYIVVYLLSGIVHLTGLSVHNRGYFDLLSGDYSGGSAEAIVFSALLAVVGLLGLIVGAMGLIGRQQLPQPIPLLRVIADGNWSLLGFGVILMLAGGWALTKINSGVLDSGQLRIITVPEGMARYVFLSQWVIWGATFSALWCIHAFRRSRSLIVPVLLLTTVPFMFWSQGWTGGRSFGFVMSLPLIILSFRLVGGIKYPMAALMGIGVSVYIFLVTGYRKSEYLDPEFRFFEILDWEYGRFSMIGFALDVVRGEGYLLGETFVAGILRLLNGMMSLLFSFELKHGFRLITEVSGEFFHGSREVIYIVPGYTAELFLNFGFIGVFLGYFLLGTLLKYLERRISQVSTVYSKIFFIYLSVILSFQLINGHFSHALAYVLFTGFPVVLLMLLRFGKRDQFVGGWNHAYGR
jgi:hypothetical protein